MKVCPPHPSTFAVADFFLFPGKRTAAQKAEKDFFALLRENHPNEKSVWKDFKRKISSDPRYEAVGSSSLREELFSAFLKANAGDSSTSHPVASSSKSPGKRAEEALEEAERKKKEKRERALREREQKVKADLSKAEEQIGRSRAGLNKEEDERDFRCAQSTLPRRWIYAALNTIPLCFFQDTTHRCCPRPTGKLTVSMGPCTQRLCFSGHVEFCPSTT